MAERVPGFCSTVRATRKRRHANARSRSLSLWYAGLLSALLATSLARFATAQTGPAQAEPAKAAAPQSAEAPAATQPVEQVSTLRERLNQQLVEQAELAVEQARLAEKRAERHYNLLSRLADKGIVPKEDVQTALSDWEDEKLLARQAELRLEQTKLDLIRDAIRVDVVAAQKYRTEAGELKVDVTLLNNANLARARAVEADKDEADLVETLRLSGVVVCLCNGAIISDPYEQVIPELPYQGQVTLTFGLLVDLEEVSVVVRYLDTERSLRVRLRKAATREYPTINSAQFSQEGSMGTRVRYDVALERFAQEEKSFRLMAVGLPGEVTWTFTNPASGARVNQVKFDENTPKHALALEVALPENLSAQFIDRTIQFEAVVTDEPGMRLVQQAVAANPLGTRTAGVSGFAGNTVTLELIPRGVGKLELSVPNRYREIAPGSVVEVDATVRNSGTAAVQNVRFSAVLPHQWRARLEPEEVKELNPNAEMQLVALIEPGADLGVGEYDVRLQAAGEVGDVKVEAEDRTVSVRVQAKTNLVAGIVLVVLLVGVLLVIGFISVRISRR